MASYARTLEYALCFQSYRVASGPKRPFLFPKGRKLRNHRGVPIIASTSSGNRYPSRVLSPKTALSLDTAQNSKMKRRTKSLNEDDTLFDLDGFHENKNCEPFFESEDESSGMFLCLSL